MYCKNCGSEIDDNAMVCPYCGVMTDKANGQLASQKSGSNAIAIVGFILSFFFWIPGLICSIVGLKNAPQYGGKGKGLAIAGIVLSVLSGVFVIFYVALSIVNGGTNMFLY